MKQLFNKNAIIRFWLSYMTVLIVIFVTCLFGIHKALEIVKQNALQEGYNLLKQGVSDEEYTFHNLYVCGMQLSSSESLKQLGANEDDQSISYYYQVKDEIKQLTETIKYLDSDMYEETFLYINKTDRVLYSGGVCRQDIFQPYLEHWGFGEQELEEECNAKISAPYFYNTTGGELFYVFPCITSLLNKERLATIFFHIGESAIYEQMQFLQNYQSYSIFMMYEEEILLCHDDLNLRDSVQNYQNMSSGAYDIENKIVVREAFQTLDKCSFVLILPENEALIKINRLKRYIFIPITFAMLIGIIFSGYFAIKSGKPINAIAHKIQNRNENENVFSTDLSYINRTIEQIMEEQINDKETLQQSFFHNLLKADFISLSELEYMASRADIQLIGKRYYAVAVRLFPEIDSDHIDGQTLEEARAIYLILMEYLSVKYTNAIWSYKRNTLVVQYIIQNDSITIQQLKNEIGQTMQWLKATHNVTSQWGIGSPCDDLMNFWKSGEESYTALGYEGEKEAVTLYNETKGEDSSFYLPYSVEEHLAKGLNYYERESEPQKFKQKPVP